MKKISVIFMIVFVFLLMSFVNGQDCGKCPLKCKKKTVKKVDTPEPVVLMNKSDKMYHQKDCKIVKNQEGYTEVVLSKALKQGAKPCTVCTPPEKPTLSQKITKKKESK